MSPHPTPRRRLLILDDEPLVGRALARMLSPSFEVVVVSSGSAALELLRQDSRFDGILSDVMMPEMSGVDFCRELERRHPEAAKRLVFMTGGIPDDRARAFVEEGRYRKIDKPLSAEALRATCEEVFSAAAR